MTTDAHKDCPSFAWQPVRCDRCGREYTCSPSDDYYCAAEGDHCCERCLIDNRRLTVLSADFSPLTALEATS